MKCWNTENLPLVQLNSFIFDTQLDNPHRLMTLAEYLHSKKDTILNNWLETIQEKIPEVKKHDETAIENSVPELLDAMVDKLVMDDESGISEHSQKHALDRSRYQIYSLKHIIQEYHLLRIEIFRQADDFEGLDIEGRDVIMYTVDQAIEMAAETFYRIKQGVQVDARQIAERKADELELKDEYREEFIHSISHDLNNPLSNIKGCISLLEGDVNVEDVGKILSILRTSADQADALVRGFLDVHTVSSAQKLPVKRVLVDIVEDLANEIKVYEVAQKRKIELKCEHEKLEVEVDVSLIRRAFNNLMSNALKHGDEKAKISIACNLESNLLKIMVHNHGGEIPEKVMQTIFNRYYQLNEKGRGWGIGLSFVKEVVEAHGGEVTVESHENDGTTFAMCLPV